MLGRAGKTVVTKCGMKVYANEILRKKKGANAVINMFLVQPEYFELYKALKKERFPEAANICTYFTM